MMLMSPETTFCSEMGNNYPQLTTLKLMVTTKFREFYNIPYSEKAPTVRGTTTIEVALCVFVRVFNLPQCTSTCLNSFR